MLQLKYRIPETLKKYIPTVESLGSIVMTHRFHDVFNPPALSNYAGEVQAAKGVTAIRNIHFPPLSQGEINVAPLGSNGSLVTGLLYVDGVYLAAGNEPVDYRWQPGVIERKAVHDGLEFVSRTILPFDMTAVQVNIQIRNTSGRPIRKEIKLAISGGVTRSVSAWDEALAPGEFDNVAEVNEPEGYVLFKALHSDAYSVQGCWPRPEEVDKSWLVYNLELESGEMKEITFTDVVSSGREQALAGYMKIRNSFDELLTETSERWNQELRAAFTPGNDTFSGYLPLLKTDNEALLHLYHMTVFTALSFRRSTKDSVCGTIYVTLAPRYWVTTTVLWDISLSSGLLSLLDPEVLRKMMEIWMEAGVHEFFGTEYLTGKAIGASYSVNDYAMCRMARDYLRWTGDFDWLETVIGGKSVFDHLISYATYWKKLDKRGHGLADYGGAENLLEALGNYTHEVAGMNAGNVFNMRFAVELMGLRNRTKEAAMYRTEAESLLDRVRTLYVEGEGVWYCNQPDGSRNVVRHCYDFCTILNTLSADLTEQQKREMVHFFQDELQTPTWMRALSLRDHDVTFSIRPDHQWTGSYPAWPALALNALLNVGEIDSAVTWMQGLSRTTRQGPLGQAHFAEDVFPPEPDGGALKVTSDQLYINDWSCIAALAFFEPVIEGFMGVKAGFDGTLHADPVVHEKLGELSLINLNYQGKSRDIEKGK